MSISKSILKLKKENQCRFAVLIDPEKYESSSLKKLLSELNKSTCGYILVGGSTSSATQTASLILEIKANTKIPVLIFPGAETKADKNADGFMLLSLISGRNPEYLIGKHVLNSVALKKAGTEILPTAYILIDGEKVSTTQYITNTMPIPIGKSELVVATALAGEQLGLMFIYLEAGSGAIKPVEGITIKSVAKICASPIFVGGGIRTIKQIKDAKNFGASVVVIGTAIEKNEISISEISKIFSKN